MDICGGSRGDGESSLRHCGVSSSMSRSSRSANPDHRRWEKFVLAWKPNSDWSGSVVNGVLSVFTCLRWFYFGGTEHLPFPFERGPCATQSHCLLFLELGHIAVSLGVVVGMFSKCCTFLTWPHFS